MTLKITGKRYLTILLCSLLLVAQSAISTQVLFSEDFNSGNLEEWIAFAWKDHSIPLNHTYSIQSGSLISSGTSYEFNTINYICQKTEIDNAIYQYDLYIPSEGDMFRFGFRISEFPPHSASHPDKFEERPSLVQTVFTMGVANPQPAILIGQHHLGDSSFTNLVNRPVSKNTILGWHTYEMHKNSTHISVFLDGGYITMAEIIQSKVATFDSICMWTDSGNGIKVDNISVFSLTDTETPISPDTIMSNGTTSDNTISHSTTSETSTGEDMAFRHMFFITLLTPILIIVVRSTKSRTS